MTALLGCIKFQLISVTLSKCHSRCFRPSPCLNIGSHIKTTSASTARSTLRTMLHHDGSMSLVYATRATEIVSFEDYTNRENGGRRISKRRNAKWLALRQYVLDIQSVVGYQLTMLFRQPMLHSLEMFPRDMPHPRHLNRRHLSLSLL